MLSLIAALLVSQFTDNDLAFMAAGEEFVVSAIPGYRPAYSGLILALGSPEKRDRDKAERLLQEKAKEDPRFLFHVERIRDSEIRSRLRWIFTYTFMRCEECNAEGLLKCFEKGQSQHWKCSICGGYRYMHDSEGREKCFYCKGLKLRTVFGLREDILKEKS